MWATGLRRAAISATTANQKSFSDDRFTLAGTILVCVISPVASSVWSIRRSEQRDIVVRLAAILERNEQVPGCLE
jgi:hypothetical protein